MLNGGYDPDRLYGQDGQDTIYGSYGNDRLSGGYGGDTLNGGFGADTLRGQAGKDELWGRAGSDVFDFNYVTDSRVGAAGRDVVRDWDAYDRLDIDGLDANRSQAGNQDFTFLGERAANNVVVQGQVKYYHSGGNTYVVLNQTADTTADFQLNIVGIHDLTAGDFLGIL